MVGTDRMSLIALRGEAPAFELEARVIPKGWMGKAHLDQRPRVEKGGTRVYEQKDVSFEAGRDSKGKRGGFDLRCETAQTASGGVSVKFIARPQTDMQYGMPNDGVGISMVIGMHTYLAGGSCAIETADGKSAEHPYPLPRGSCPGVKTAVLKTARGEATRLVFDPPLYIHADHSEMRMFANPKEVTPAGAEMTQTFVVQPPQAAAFEPENRWTDTSAWFAYEKTGDFSPGSVIGCEDWLEKPAGKHGWLKTDTDDFVFADGTKIKFFGTNISWDDMACPREQADLCNDKWAKHGVNLVRLHKFIDHGWAGIMTEQDHMIPDPEKIPLFDYYHASAKKRGIYLGWSPVFTWGLTPADKTRVKYYDEIEKNDPKKRGVIGVTNIAPDLQDLLIKQVSAMLSRKNEVTGLRYADDPALAYVELHNEDDIFFPFDNYVKMEKAYPKYFADYQARFVAYLKDKYKTQEALEKAWGASYPKGKTLAAGKGGCQVFKKDGKYHLLAANEWGDMIERTTDALHGPYRNPRLAFAQTGQAGIFADAAGQYRAVTSTATGRK